MVQDVKLSNLKAIVDKVSIALELSPSNPNEIRCDKYHLPILILCYIDKLLLVYLDGEYITKTMITALCKIKLFLPKELLKNPTEDDVDYLIEYIDEKFINEISNLIVSDDYFIALNNLPEVKDRYEMIETSVAGSKVVSELAELYLKKFTPAYRKIFLHEIADEIWKKGITIRTEVIELSKKCFEGIDKDRLEKVINTGSERDNVEMSERMLDFESLLEIDGSEILDEDEDEENLSDENYFLIHKRSLNRCNKIIKVDERKKIESIYNTVDIEEREFIKSLCLASAASAIHYSDVSDLDDLRNAELVIDTRVILLATLLNPKSQGVISKYLGVNFPQVKYPGSVYDCCSSLLEFAERYNYCDTRIDSFIHIVNSRVGSMKCSSVMSSAVIEYERYNDNHSNNTNSNISSFSELIIEAVLNYSEEQSFELPLITELIKLNKVTNNTIQLLKNKHEIRDSLSDIVVGQKEAVESLCDEWFSSSIKSNDGPRMICTFAGPSGVGKSYLARSFCDLLNDVEGTDYRFTEISMAQLSDGRDTGVLFGTSQTYASATSGVLTNAVKFYPRHIILFDELEKAHPNVIQSMLSFLDNGLEKDATTGIDVDFSQTILIFTTNLGQNKIRNNKGRHHLDIMDLLSTREQSTSSLTGSLSPEMINRLAKGAAIAFNQLKVNHLIKISKNVIKHSNTSMSDIRINWGDGFEYCYMKMLAPNITSRRIGSELSKISSKILTTISDSLPETDRGLIIKVDFNDHDDIVKDRSLLLVDDDERVLKALKLTHKRTKFNLVDNVSDAVFKLKNLTPSAILLDIQILGDSLNLIHKSIDIIVDANSTVPIFLYKIGKPNSALISLEENENVRKVFFINDSGLENSGDIPPWISEGLMDVYSDSREIVLKETTKLINSVFYTIKNEEEINKLIRLNERISYSLSSDSESPFMVNINLDNPTQIISSEDSSKAMFGREIPKERLVDIVGLDRAKERVQQVIECLGKPELFTDKSVRPPTGYLIAGMPGTGKTMLARAVAGECELPFFTLSVAEIVDSGDGGPVAKIRELFEMARKYAPSIIFLDEIDAYAGKRGIGGNPVIVNTLLTEMDGFSKSDLPVFILAATNFPEKLDNALVRSGRFDEIIQCDHPNYEARVKLLNKLFTTSKQETQLSSNDMKTIATTSVGMTAAQLDQIHREAIYKYRATQLVVKLDDIQEIIYRVRYGSPSESTELTLEAKWETAYHESGHLIMRKLLMPESKIDYVTIEPRDMALGFVAHLPDEQYSSTTLKSLKNTVCVLLAGREAEKQYAGSFEGISTGASGDLRASTNLIYYAVCNGGLGEGLPPISVEVAKRYIDSKFSDYEQVTKSIVFECEKRTEKLLKDNYEIHEKFSKYLFEKESLINSEISEFFEGVEFKENS